MTERTMKITGKSGKTYEVAWAESGFTWAVPVILKNRWWLWPKRITLNTPNAAKPRLEADRMLPKDMRRWFQESIDYHEEYEAAWAEPTQKEPTP